MSDVSSSDVPRRKRRPAKAVCRWVEGMCLIQFGERVICEERVKWTTLAALDATHWKVPNWRGTAEFALTPGHGKRELWLLDGKKRVTFVVKRRD